MNKDTYNDEQEKINAKAHQKLNRMYDSVDTSWFGYVDNMQKFMPILMIALGLILGIFLAVLQGKNGALLQNVILMAIGYGLLGAGVGAFLGFGFYKVIAYFYCPIIYPLYWIYCKIRKATMNTAKREAAIERARSEALEALKQQQEQELQQQEQATLKISQRFSNNQLVNEAACAYAKDMILQIKLAQRESYVKLVTVRFYISVSQNEIRTSNYPYRSYNFAKYRYEQLVDPKMREAFAYALANQLKKEVLARYKQDESGSSYTIKIEYDSREAILIYTARNENYKDLQKW